MDYHVGKLTEALSLFSFLASACNRRILAFTETQNNVQGVIDETVVSENKSSRLMGVLGSRRT